jgi:RNA polymerase sigma factor (TIGR02999 family)
MHKREDITGLLIELTGGNQTVVNELWPVVYDELKRLASAYLRRERSNHTLQPTALVHEVYLKLIDQTRVSWQNRAHFFGVAAQLMRRILLDHAKLYKVEKRGRRIPEYRFSGCSGFAFIESETVYRPPDQLGFKIPKRPV